MTPTERFARRLARLENEVRAIGSTPQLAYSSVEGGTLDFNGLDGSLGITVGQQFDGTNTVLYTNGPTPPTPSAPICVDVLEGGRIRWDGVFTDAIMAPLDFARMEVHASIDPMFTAEFASTLIATFETPRGGEVYVNLPSGTYYVKFVTRTLSGQRSTPSVYTVLTPQPFDDFIPAGSDGAVPANQNLGLVARSGILSADLSWSAHTNPDPVLYDVLMTVDPAVPTGTNDAAELLTTTSATRLHVTTKPNKTNVVETEVYNFAVRVHDVDGPQPVLQGPVSAQPRLASNAEISADFAYFGEVSFNQLTGGKIGADFILGAKFVTANSGKRVETGPEGVSIHSTAGPRIVLPTDDTQIAIFNGSASMDGLVVKNGLEIRGDSNRFTIGSKVVLETKTQGSASPPSVIVDYPKVDLGLKPYLFGITGLHLNEFQQPVMQTEVFFSDSAITNVTAGTRWQPPQVGVNGSFIQRELQFYSGMVEIWDTAASEYRYVLAGPKFQSQPSGLASYVNITMRKYDVSAMVANGSVAPTQIGTDAVHPRANGFLHPRVGRNITDRTQFVSAEMSGGTDQVLLRRWSNSMVQVGSTITTAVLPNSSLYFRDCKGVMAGRAVDMGFHPTDTTEIFVVALSEDLYNDETTPPNRRAYVFNATTGTRLPNYEFDLDAVEGIFIASHATSSGGYKSFIHGRTDPWTKYTDVAWTTEPSTWHAGFDWRSSAGWKSNVSVVNTFTMKKRARVTLTSPDLPSPAAGIGTTPTSDDVTSVGFYLSRSNPVRTDLYLQSPTPSVGVTSQSFTTMPVFSGTNPVATTTFPDQASARFESSSSTNGVPNFLLTGDGFAHFEELDISGQGSTSLSGKAFEQLYYSIRAQSQMAGGGIKTVSSTYACQWSARFIAISLGNSDSAFPQGYHEINTPSGSTVTNRSITSAIGSMTAPTTTKFRKGDSVSIAGLDATFNGIKTVYDYNSTTGVLRVNLPGASNLSATASAGTVRPVAVGFGGATTQEIANGDFTLDAWSALYYVLPFGANPTVSVTNKSLTSNVATLTIAAGHQLALGDAAYVSIGDAVFDGRFIITAITPTSISYAKTNANVASVAATGTVTNDNSQTFLDNFKLVSYTSDFVVPNDWLLIAQRNGDDASVEWITGEKVDAGYDSDSPKFKQAIFESSTDASTAGGNKPAVRIGSITGGHLRIDGNEILAMSNNTTQSGLSLNLAGRTNVTDLSIAGNVISNVNFSALTDFPAAVTGSFTANANINPSGGRLRRDTSSRRYKENEREVDLDVDLILSLPPKVFQRNDERDPETDELIGYREDNPWYTGFIAEDAKDRGLDPWVVWNGDEVDGFAYDKWVVALQAVARKQHAAIQALEARLADLESR